MKDNNQVIFVREKEAIDKIVEQICRTPKSHVFIDLSGSTYGNSNYFNDITYLVNSLTEKNIIEKVNFYAWANSVALVSLRDVIWFCKEKKPSRDVGEPIGGGTYLQPVLKNIQDNTTKESLSVIITDGEIVDNRKDSFNIFCDITVIGINNDKLNDSIPMSLKSIKDLKNKNIVIFYNNTDVSLILKDTSNLSDEDRFSEIDHIDISQFKDADYVQKLFQKMRAISAQKDSHFIAELKKKLSKKLTQSIKSINNIEVDENLFVQKDFSQLQDIIFKEQINLVDPTVVNEVLARCISIVELSNRFVDMDIYQKYSKEIEAITPKHNDYQPMEEENGENGVDQEDVDQEYIVEDPIMYTSYDGVNLILNPFPNLSKQTLNSLKSNPLLLLRSLKNDSFGSYTSLQPSELNYEDPTSRRKIECVLSFGNNFLQCTKSNNYALAKWLFKGFKVCDPDLLLVAIWYFLKYKSSRLESLEAVLKPLEKHIYERFKTSESNLSMRINGHENGHKFFSKKWCAVFFLVHELTYFTLKNQDGDFMSKIKHLDHVSISRFIYDHEILIAFLKDIFGVSISDVVKSDLLLLKNFFTLRKIFNQFGEDFIIKMLRIAKDGGEFWIEPPKRDLEDNTLHIIPVEQGEQVIYKIFEYFKIDLAVDEFIEVSLALLAYCNRGITGDDGGNLQDKVIKWLGFDPMKTSNNWNKYYQSNKFVNPKLNSKTLRPEFITSSGTWKDSFTEAIDDEGPFMSLYQQMLLYILENKRMPYKTNEFLIYLFVKQQKSMNVGWVSKKNGVERKDKNLLINFMAKCVSLPPNIVKLADRVFLQYSKALSQFWETDPWDFKAKEKDILKNIKRYVSTTSRIADETTSMIY